MASSSSSAPQPRGGKYCVAGGPNQATCTNSRHTDGISIHTLPDEEKAPERRKKWVRFVRKHRPHFTPSRSQVLCSAHFEQSSFTMNVSVSISLGMKRRKSTETAVPTVDVAGIDVPSSPSTEELIWERKRRQVRAYH